jgi:hypothetical protein
VCELGIEPRGAFGDELGADVGGTDIDAADKAAVAICIDQNDHDYPVHHELGEQGTRGSEMDSGESRRASSGKRLLARR